MFDPYFSTSQLCVVSPSRGFHSFFMTEPTPNSTSPADFCSVVVMPVPTGASESYGWPHEHSTKQIFSCTFTLDFRAQSFLQLLMSL